MIDGLGSKGLPEDLLAQLKRDSQQDEERFLERTICNGIDDCKITHQQQATLIQLLDAVAI